MYRTIAQNLLVAVAYWLMGALCLAFAFQGSFVTFIWPSAGLAFTVVILGGYRLLPGVYLGTIAIALWAGLPWYLGLLLGLGTAAEPAAARYILTRLRFLPDLRRQWDAFAFLAVAVVLCSCISAGLGIVALYVSGVTPAPGLLGAVRIWWLSNMTGALITAPLLLIWWRDLRSPYLFWRTVEAACFFPLLLALCIFFFIDPFGFDLRNYPLGSLMIPFILVASIRYGARGATLAVNLIAMVVVVGASMAEGPFLAGFDFPDIAGVWLYLFILGLTTLGVITLRAEQEGATLALQKNEERYRSLVENVNDVIFHLDTEGNFTYVSPVMERISHYQREDVEGRSFLDFVYPDDVGGLLESLQRTLSGATEPYSFRVVDKDGSILKVKTSSRLIYERGEVVGVSGVMTNITAESAMAEALRESERRLQMALDGGNLALWDLDLESDTVLFSARWAEMTGCPPGELHCESAVWMRRIHPDDKSGMRFQLERHFKGETPFYEAEHRILKADGDYVWIQSRGRVFARTADGAPARAVGTCLDISKRKQAEADHAHLEAQIQHAQKLESLGVLAGGIAHDFNNLLVGILGNADLGLLELPASSSSRAYFHNIVVSSQRAADLCKQMLAYSGKGHFIIEGIQVNALIEEMIHLLEVSISKNAILKCRLAHNLPTVEGDPTQLRQVIMNLITNASEALEEKSGVITVSTDLMHCDRSYLSRLFVNELLDEGLYVCLEVSDSGCGMDPQTRDRIFEPFFTTKFTGRGLGMAAVLGIVRGHKGAIKVYSEPGKGSTFKVLLPAAACPMPPPPEGEEGPANWRGVGTILVVDDEPGVRAICKETFEHYGLRVLTAADGREGLERFRKHEDEISAVLLDMTMPHMNGEEVFRELRNIQPGVRVVLTSGYNEQDATGRFAGKGLAAFIQKPFRTDELINCFRKVLGPLPTP